MRDLCTGSWPEMAHYCDECGAREEEEEIKVRSYTLAVVSLNTLRYIEEQYITQGLVPFCAIIPVMSLLLCSAI